MEGLGHVVASPHRQDVIYGVSLQRQNSDASVIIPGFGEERGGGPVPRLRKKILETEERPGCSKALGKVPWGVRPQSGLLPIKPRQLTHSHTVPSLPSHPARAQRPATTVGHGTFGTP